MKPSLSSKARAGKWSFKTFQPLNRFAQFKTFE